MSLEAYEDQGLIEAAVARIERFPDMHRPGPEPLRGTEVGGQERAEVAERCVA